MVARQGDETRNGQEDVEIDRVVLDPDAEAVQASGNLSEELDQLLLREASDRRGLENDPIRSRRLRGPGEGDLSGDRGLAHRHRVRDAPVDEFARQPDQFQALVHVHLVNLGHEAEHRDAMGAGGDAMLHLEPHLLAVEAAIPAPEGIKDRIDTGVAAALGHGGPHATIWLKTDSSG
jgi:hypothetical protein